MFLFIPDTTIQILQHFFCHWHCRWVLVGFWKNVFSFRADLQDVLNTHKKLQQKNLSYWQLFLISYSWKWTSLSREKDREINYLGALYKLTLHHFELKRKSELPYVFGKSAIKRTFKKRQYPNRKRNIFHKSKISFPKIFQKSNQKYCFNFKSLEYILCTDKCVLFLLKNK